MCSSQCEGLRVCTCVCVNACDCTCLRVCLRTRSLALKHAHHSPPQPLNPPPQVRHGPCTYTFFNGKRLQVQHVTRHISRVTSHASHLTRHTSHLTPHINTHFWFQIPHTSQCTWKDGACPEFNHMQQKVIRMTCHVSLVMFDVVYVTCDL